MTVATPAAPAPQETKPADESLGSRVLRVLLTQRIALLAVPAASNASGSKPPRSVKRQCSWVVSGTGSAR